MSSVVPNSPSVHHAFKKNLVTLEGFSLQQSTMPSGKFALNLTYRTTQGERELRALGFTSKEVCEIEKEVSMLEIPPACRTSETFYRALCGVSALSNASKRVHYKNGFFRECAKDLESALDSLSYEQFKELVSVTKVRSSIFLLSFPFTEMAAAMFLRMQEHYESPHFKGRLFSRSDFKEWYRKNQSPRYDFSYYQDWGGFNVPSAYGEPFVRGDFTPYSPAEENMRRLINEHTAGLQRYYLIGFGGSTEADILDTKRHELCHALFTTEPEYQTHVLRSLEILDKKIFFDCFTSMGYHRDVHEDELHAYLSVSPEYLAKLAGLKDLPKGYHEVHQKLHALFESYIPSEVS